MLKIQVIDPLNKDDVLTATPLNYIEENAVTNDIQFYRHGNPLPGIEGFQIVGEPRPGCILRACGFPTNGTTLCNFQWVRYFEDGTRHSIEGATMYDYMVTADDVGTRLAVDCTPMDDNGCQVITDKGFKFGVISIVEAIDYLASYDGDTTASDNQLRNWLLRLVVVFAESIRNNTVLDHVARELPVPGIETMTQFPWQLIGLIKDWSSLCTLLLQVINDVVQDPDVMVQRFSPYARYNIHNAFQLASMLGMVLIKNPNRQHGRRPRRSVDNNPDGAVAGITLLEVVEVIVLDIDGETPGDLYGMITVTDGFGPQIIFERDWWTIQSVHPGEQAKLTGPGRAVNGEVVWSPLDATRDDYDKLHSTVVTGERGKVELRYAIMTDAAVATVEVVLLQSSESSPNVYGTVTTTVNLDDDDGTAVTVKLMDRDNTESVDVERGSAIPLMRKAVAVPLSSELQVSLDLWDRNLIFADEQIANGAAMFQPLLTGGESQEVDNGRVKVRVNWSTWFEL
ncbi:hypothetical protein QOZ80_5BG0452730 [Eleusine coracana subsp. coracana]|nr:hypothetical protein QOZ80_5BG0452730 [Eleusine coracana subsp. coracana]